VGLTQRRDTEFIKLLDPTYEGEYQRITIIYQRALQADSKDLCKVLVDLKMEDRIDTHHGKGYQAVTEADSLIDAIYKMHEKLRMKLWKKNERRGIMQPPDQNM
jgi:hypothetical protein